jgi:hypothetical protein
MSGDQFYLGKQYDLAKKQAGGKLTYDPSDLTTHAAIFGMTGSGKTGLCIALMEEAALQGIPAILIDPKGDLTNLLLHFPDLAPQDFSTWLDADTIRRQGKTLDQASAETADQWRKGLAEWGIGKDRLLALKNAAQYAVFTPGSDAGIPVSVLSSLEVPPLEWEGNKEILRERISSTVTALLGLVGYDDVDPIRSREHILIANIFESAWSKGKSLDLTELILQVQKPPFEKLGAFAVESFFPEKDRMSLAMALNNILASPAFQTWREGQPLDVAALMRTADGRPRQSVFYIAHLSESERMFFITLLLSSIETWMRTQSGSSSLRAILYFDEIFGYLPPQSNPPSKQPMLRMLKQARAFGLGLVLATQNPVDVDYKALSNAGTWFIGKLQTERDKDRLLDGLQSANADMDRDMYGKVISALGKRVFLLHNVHAKKPELFQTRWAMNYLAGPLTRTQIPALNQLAGAELDPAALDRNPVADAIPPAETESDQAFPDLSHFQPIPAAQEDKPVARSKPSPNVKNVKEELSGTLTKPALPSGINEYFLPLNYSLTEAFRAAGETMPPDARQTGIIYRAVLLASAQIRFLDRKLGVDSEMNRSSLVDQFEAKGFIRWDDFPYAGPDLDSLDPSPAPQATFDVLPSALTNVKNISALQKDFTDWAFRTSSVMARANEALKVYAGPDVTLADFKKACADAARDARDKEIEKIAAGIERKLKALNDKLAREERELKMDEQEYNNRKWEENATHAENVLGIFSKRSNYRKISSSLTKRRQTEQAKAQIEESVEAIEQYEREIDALQKQYEQITSEINDRWASVVNQMDEIKVSPKKTDVRVSYFGAAWMPFYLFDAHGEVFELPAFGAE